MKKLFFIILVSFYFSLNSIAEPVLIGCYEDEPSPDEINVDFFSLDLDKNKYTLLGNIVKMKKCALGDCTEVNEYNRNLPLIYNEPGYISVGVEDENQYTFNKKDLSMTWAFYYWSEIGSTNTFKQVNVLSYHNCDKIDKLPYK